MRMMIISAVAMLALAACGQTAEPPPPAPEPETPAQKPAGGLFGRIRGR